MPDSRLRSWRGLEEYLVKACSKPMEAVWQETNKWLIERGVLPEVDLRGAIRRSDGSSTSPGGLTPEPDPPATRRWSEHPLCRHVGRLRAHADGGRTLQRLWTHGTAAWGVHRPVLLERARSDRPAGNDPFGGGPRPPQSILHGHSIEDETRMMTRPAAGASARADVVLEHFSEVMERPSARLSRHRSRTARVGTAVGGDGQGAAAPGGAGRRPGRRRRHSSGAVAGVGPAPEIFLQELRDRQSR
jgi:hypothetical protein